MNYKYFSSTDFDDCKDYNFLYDHDLTVLAHALNFYIGHINREIVRGGDIMQSYSYFYDRRDEVYGELKQLFIKLSLDKFRFICKKIYKIIGLVEKSIEEDFEDLGTWSPLPESLSGEALDPNCIMEDGGLPNLEIQNYLFRYNTDEGKQKLLQEIQTGLDVDKENLEIVLDQYRQVFIDNYIFWYKEFLTHIRIRIRDYFEDEDKVFAPKPTKSEGLPIRKLFDDEIAFNFAITMLQEFEPMVIDSDLKFLNPTNGISIIVAWIEALKIQGKILHQSSRNLSSILQMSFNMKIDHTNFSSKSILVAKYKDFFLSRLRSKGIGPIIRQ